MGKKREPGPTQGKRQWAQVEIQELCFEYKKVFWVVLGCFCFVLLLLFMFVLIVHHEGDQTGCQRGCKVCVLPNTQNLTGHSNLLLLTLLWAHDLFKTSLGSFVLLCLFVCLFSFNLCAWLPRSYGEEQKLGRKVLAFTTVTLLS